MNADRSAKRSNIMSFRFSSIVMMVLSSAWILSSVFTVGPFRSGGEWHRHSSGHGLASFSSALPVRSSPRPAGFPCFGAGFFFHGSSLRVAGWAVN